MKNWNLKRVLLGCIVMMLVIVPVLSLSACLGPAQEKGDAAEAQRTKLALGTVITLKVYGPGGGEALDKVISRIEEIEEHMSANIESSDVSRINRNVGQDVKVHDDTFYVIEKALHYSELSEGAFDVAILPIVNLWGIGTEELKRKGYPVPTRQQIDALLDKVDYRMVAIDKEKKTVRLEKEGMGLDLGGIAKGYAADEAARILRKMGIKSAIINMGGNVYALGRKPDGSAWKVGIRDPRGGEKETKHVAIVEAADQTVVTSGDYERFFIKDGIRYHHIFDPRTGQPSRSGLISVTIVGNSSIDADALSTTVFILGAEKGLELLDNMEGVEALVITENKAVLATSGLKNTVNITNKEYKLQ